MMDAVCSCIRYIDKLWISITEKLRNLLPFFYFKKNGSCFCAINTRKVG